MWSKSITSILTICCIVIILFSFTDLSSQLSYAKFASISSQSPDSSKKTKVPGDRTSWTSISIGLPIRLTIAKINVNTTIQHMGLTPNGAMDVPVGPADVSWFRLGTIPGHTGSAVIAWHYGIWKNGDISVFHDLHTLRKGDIVSIKDDKGAIITFVVTKLRIYDADADTSSVFRSSDGKSHLNIITCVWDKKSNTYPQRLVVFTERVL